MTSSPDVGRTEPRNPNHSPTRHPILSLTAPGAHAAYELWEERYGEARLDTDLTSEQVLFVSFGQVWCSLVSEEFERMQVTVDSHSPGRFRVIGPVSQNPDFATAFACEPGEPMAPADRCQVW